MKKNVLVFFIATISALFFCEILLRVTHTCDTYSELTSGKYATDFGKVIHTPLHTNTPNSELNYTQPEFSFVNRYNNKGVRELAIAPTDTNVKYLFLGDSFTEGDGAPYQQSMPRYFEKLLGNESSKPLVYNAGVCGSDPIYSYMFYKLALGSFQFKTVFLVINSGDIDDLFVRGGFDRYRQNGDVVFRSKTTHNLLFQYSRIYRLISGYFGYDELGMNRRVPPSTYVTQLKQVAQAIDSMNYLCKSRGAKLFVVSHPFPQAFKNPVFTNYIPPYERYLDTQNITFINLHNSLKEELSNMASDKYSWKKNGHFKPLGYQVFAKQLYALWKSIEKQPILPQISMR